MYSNLIKLAKLTAETKYDNYADKLNKAFKTIVEQAPGGFSQFLSGLNLSTASSYEIIVVGELNNESTEEILETINSEFIPNKVVMVIDNLTKEKVNLLAPFIKDYEATDGKTTVYVCKNYICNLPTTDKNKVIEMLIK